MIYDPKYTKHEFLHSDHITFILHEIVGYLFQVCRSRSTRVTAVAPVTTVRHVSATCIHTCAAPGLTTGVIISRAAGVGCPLEGEGKLTQSAVTCPAHDTCLLSDVATYPGHVAQHVGVDPRPPVCQTTLCVTKTDQAQQDKVSVKPPELRNCHNNSAKFCVRIPCDESASRVSAAGVRHSPSVLVTS